LLIHSRPWLSATRTRKS
jgi:Uncharacterized protein conserved in bacteria